MAPHCCVPQCTSSHRKKSNRGQTFHRFPTDLGLRREWIIKIKRDPGRHFKINTYTKVCSEHFLPDCQVKTKAGITKLKHGAVPTVFAWSSFRPEWSETTPPPYPDHEYAALPPSLQDQLEEARKTIADQEILIAELQQQLLGVSNFQSDGWTPRETPAAAPTRPPPCHPETPAAASTRPPPCPPETPAAAPTRPPPCPPETPAAASTRPPPCPPETPAAAPTRPPPCPPETPAAASTRPPPCLPETPAGASSNGLEQEVLQHAACREAPSPPRPVQEETRTYKKKSLTASDAGMWTIGGLRAVLQHPVTGDNAEMRGYVQRTIAEYREGVSLLQGEKSRQWKLLTAAWSPQVRLDRAEVLQHAACREAPSPPRPVQEETQTYKKKSLTASDAGMWTIGGLRAVLQHPVTGDNAEMRGYIQRTIAEYREGVSLLQGEKSRQWKLLTAAWSPQVRLDRAEVLQHAACREAPSHRPVQEKTWTPGTQVKEEEEPWNPGLPVKEEREEEPRNQGLQVKEEVAEEPWNPGLPVKEEREEEPRNQGLQVKEEVAEEPWNPGLPVKEEREELWVSPGGDSGQETKGKDVIQDPSSPCSVKTEDAPPPPTDPTEAGPPTRDSEADIKPEPQPLSFVSDHYATAQPQPLSRVSDGYEAAQRQPLSCVSDQFETTEPQPRSCVSDQFDTTSDRPLRCEFCTSSFKFKSGLDRHLHVHTRERPYTCSSCGLTYTAREKLIRHINIHHRITSVKCKMKA